jgi:glycosyltransferase involved in cell wall biosynthesis/membrane-associated phospholipid phosphatase
LRSSASGVEERGLSLLHPAVWVLPAVALALMAVLAATQGNVPGFRYLNGTNNPAFWSAVTFMGDTAVVLALALLAARRFPRVLWALIPAAIIATAWVHGWKKTYNESRPLATLERSEVKVIGPELRHGSFPSGHATTAFATAGVCILGLRLGLMGSLILVAIASVVGLSRVVVGAHWPMDVLAGAFGGWLAAALGIAVADRWRFGLRPRVQAVIALILVVFAIALLAGYDGRYPDAAWLARVIGACTLFGFALTFVFRPGAPMETAELPAISPAALTGDRVSIVIPVFNEAENLHELVDRVAEAMEASGADFELILVDDGSRDDSGRVLDELAESRPWLRPLQLIRNYGQSVALQAGFDHAGGDFIVTLDGDLQNDPADIPALLALMHERPHIDLISGWRKDRKDKAVSRKLPSRIANSIISSVTGVHLHDYGCALKVYRAKVIQGIRLYGEMHRFIPALAAEVGARILEVPVQHHARTRGISKYGIGRTLRVVLDLLWVKFFARFLHRPMHAFGGLGLVMLLGGFAVLAWLAWEKLALGQDIGGRPLLLLGVLFMLMGGQVIATGLIGELLIRIYHEPQGRQLYVLREPRPPKP